uniref:ARM repeat superfamily protein n=1 Tax=Oryza rufipogon TaxID=4529 RepID=A0A0E0PR24_ORYRU
MEAPAMEPGEMEAMLRAAAEFASYPGNGPSSSSSISSGSGRIIFWPALAGGGGGEIRGWGAHGDDTVRQFLEQYPLPKLLGVRLMYLGWMKLLPHAWTKYFLRDMEHHFCQAMAFIQAGLLANSKNTRQLACKAVIHLLDKAGDSAVVVDTFVQHNLYPLLMNCLTEGDEEISAISLDGIKRLAQIPKGIEIIFPPNGQGSVQLHKVAAQSSSMARIRILSLIAKLFAVSTYTATAIYDSNLLSLFEDEIKDRRDMLKTLSALEVLYELVEHPHSNIFLLKTNLLQLMVDVINDSSADSIVRSRATLISGRLLSSADAFTTIDRNCVANLLLAIDKLLKMEESQNTDETESALEALGLIGTTSAGACLLLTDSSNAARHVVEASFGRQGRGKQLAALHAFGSISGVDRQEDQIKLDNQAEERLKRFVYTTARNSPKLTPSALLLSVLQQDPDIRITGYRVISGLVAREWCLMEICSKLDIINLVTDPKMEMTKLGMEARHDCCLAISKALSSSHLLHEPSLSELIGKLNEAVKRGPYLSERKRVEPQPVVVPAESLKRGLLEWAARILTRDLWL